MNIVSKSALLCALALSAAPLAITPALAQRAATTSGGAPVVPGLAVANIDAVVVNSNAYKTAATQRQTTYKSTYDAAEARSKALTAQIQPMITKLQADSKVAKPNQAALQAQYAQIQQIQENGNQEMQRMLAPVALSEAYVNEQINDKLEAAIQSAMNKQKISVVLSPQSVIAAAGAYNLNQEILNELNAALPSAQLVPPAGWEPREVRDARAAQAQAQGRAAAPAAGRPAAPARPAGPQPDGR
jgi:Skp family chaperone for outer membrane proteins